MALTTVDSGDSFVQYTADGTIKDFPVLFPRLDAANIFVDDNGTLKTIVTDYTEQLRDPPNKNWGVLRFGTAPVNGHTVTIRRVTPTALVKHNPQIGDIEAIQALYLAQERWDTYTDLPFVFDAVDLSAGNSKYVVMPFDAVIKSADVFVNVAISTGGDITFKKGVGGTAVAGLTLTVANAAAAGARVTDTPTVGDATTFMQKGTVLEILAAAAFTGGGSVNGNVYIRRANPT